MPVRLVYSRPKNEPIPYDATAMHEFLKAEGMTREELREAIHEYLYPSPYLRIPVGPEEFVLSPYYMNARDSKGQSVVYPEVLKEIITICDGNYEEVVLTGGIGSGKTTCALYCLAYHLYLISCLRNPHELFDLDPASEIVFIFQSLNAKVATTVDYLRFQNMIDRSQYFARKFPYDPTRKSDMRFPSRVVVTPTATTISGAIGQNVISALIDEINFMQQVDKSKRVINEGAFDQAKMIYETIDRRRRSRFMKGGKLPGLLCMSSSKHYPGEFTDQKEEEAKRELDRHGKTTIYVYHKRTWDVKPETFADEPRFRVYVGSENRKPRILRDGEGVPKNQQHLIDHVPVSFLSKYETDIYGALRDISGYATASRYPFMGDVEALSNVFGKHTSILSLDECDFSEDGMLEIFPKLFRFRKKKRWVHVDLGLSSDAAGVCCGFVEDFVQIERGETSEVLPRISIDFVLRVPPPKGGEIQFFKIRKLIYALKKAGLPIKWVSFDSFQSVDSIQIMRQRGYVTGTVSMDESTVPYDLTKAAIYDERLAAPEHLRTKKELGALERDPKKGKIDHPPHGSKDCSDALAGVVYGLTTRRELWLENNVPVRAIPDSITATIQREEDRKRGVPAGDDPQTV